MNDVREIVKCVEENKSYIAGVIARVFADETGKDVDEYYSKFCDAINSAIPYFISNKKYTSKYQKGVDALVKKINDAVGYDIKPYFFKEIKFLKNSYKFFHKIEFLNENDINIEIEKKIYDKNYNNYFSIGLTFEMFYKIRRLDGQVAIDNLNLLINKLKNKTFMYKFKRGCSVFLDFYISKSYINDNLNDLVRRYKVKDLNDLMILHSEVCSFIVKEDELDEESLRVINENKNNFRKRIGENKTCFLSRFQALGLKKKIESIYRDNLFEEVFVKGKLSDFVDYYKISYENLNISRLMYLYVDLNNSLGLCTRENFGDGNKCYCFFSNEILEYDEKDLNRVIIHEFIHSIEKDSNLSSSFMVACKYLNEALTDYFAYKALDYVDKPLVEYERERISFSGGSMYDCMLPLIEIMKKSSIWETVIEAKLENDANILIKKIGLANFNEINMCFNDTYKSWMDKKELSKNIVKLNNVIAKMNNKIR